MCTFPAPFVQISVLCIEGGDYTIGVNQAGKHAHRLNVGPKWMT